MERGPQAGVTSSQRHRAATQSRDAEIWVPTEAPRLLPPETLCPLPVAGRGAPRSPQTLLAPPSEGVHVGGGTTTEPLTHLPIQPPALAPITPPGLGGRETGGPQALWAWRGCPAEHSKRVRGAGTLRRGHGPGRGAGQEAGWACRGSGSGARPPCREWPRPRGSSAQEDAVTVMDDLL